MISKQENENDNEYMLRLIQMGDESIININNIDKETLKLEIYCEKYGITKQDLINTHKDTLERLARWFDEPTNDDNLIIAAARYGERQSNARLIKSREINYHDESMNYLSEIYNSQDKANEYFNSNDSFTRKMYDAYIAGMKKINLANTN